MHPAAGLAEVLWLILDEMDEVDRTRWLRSVDGRMPSPNTRHLRGRLQRYRFDIEQGKYADLREAVKAVAEAQESQRAEQLANSRQEWEDRQLKKMRKRWLALRSLVIDSGEPCCYCEGVPHVVDHVIPRSRGGEDELTNLVPACKPCNSEKSNRTPEEWRAWRLGQGWSWPPNRSRRPCHVRHTEGCPTCEGIAA